MKIAPLYEPLAQAHGSISAQDYILIKGANTHNLKSVDVTIPKNAFVVVTGLSGSGKSSLVMDTLFAEGQRRYVESLSSYARQFMNRMKKPDVEFITGISPAIAIEQRKSSSNARSTVGSLTEIYDFLRLLYARIGKMYSPISGNEVRKHEVSDVVDYCFTLDDGTKIELHAPLYIRDTKRTIKKELEILLAKGYHRIQLGGITCDIQDFIETSGDGKLDLGQSVSTLEQQSPSIIIDRWVVKRDNKDLPTRMADSVHTAFLEGSGTVQIVNLDGSSTKTFNNRFSLDGIEFPEISPALFNYNNPYGACPKCEGYGRVLGVSERKVIPNKNLSFYEDAVLPWSTEKASIWKQRFIAHAHTIDFPIHTPYKELSDQEKELLWEGKGKTQGIYAFFEALESQAYKIQNRVLLSRYRGRTSCPQCKSYRLRKEALYVKIKDKHIGQLTQMPLDELLLHFNSILLTEQEEKIAERLTTEITSRLQILNKIGLTYLTLDRVAGTLSGGETQRIHLTRILGSNLTQSIYILDEPTIGLHPKDTHHIIDVLYQLRDLENTVIVVEHEEDVIKAADYILELGPDAGVYGGQIVYSGTKAQFAKEKDLNTYTLQYINNLSAIPLPDERRNPTQYIELLNARHHNLKGINVSIPLNAFTVICGVSGSGKSTLVNKVLAPLLVKIILGDHSMKEGESDGISGAYKILDGVELIDQNSIGRSSRSNPVTYIKAYSSIRELMASQQLSKINGYKAGHFSFNTDGGRCPHCSGDGYVTIEMQFLADVNLECEACEGKRFKDEILDVRYGGKNIFDILNMSVEEAIEFFKEEDKIVSKLSPLADVGLNYVTLGQPSNTLSGGEAQRLKLASFLAHDNMKQHTIFIFDEPTTGLHLHDIHTLLKAFQILIENGNTLIVIEHNMDVIKSADWVIELGPGGGKDGGGLVFQGAPEKLVQVKNSPTAFFFERKA